MPPRGNSGGVGKWVSLEFTEPTVLRWYAALSLHGLISGHWSTLLVIPGMDSPVRRPRQLC